MVKTNFKETKEKAPIKLKNFIFDYVENEGRMDCFAIKENFILKNISFIDLCFTNKN